MNINIIKDDYKKISIFNSLWFHIQHMINNDDLSDYVIILRQAYSKTDIQYHYIDDIDAIKGYLLQCFETTKNGFNPSNYDDFNYNDVLDYYNKMLVDSINHDVYLGYKKDMI